MNGDPRLPPLLPLLLVGGVLLLLALVPGVLPAVQLLSGLVLCLTVPGLILVPAALRRDPAAYLTLSVTSGLLVTFTAALILLYVRAFTQPGLLLLVAWFTALGWAVARLTAPRAPAAPLAPEPPQEGTAPGETEGPRQTQTVSAEVAPEKA